MNRFGHRAISAAAGTGKTWTLTHRYLALMVAGAPPDRICALTFSRKAAGEIFDSIVERLCDAILDPNKRQATCAELQRHLATLTGIQPPGSEAAYLDLLRRLMDQAHRLRIGTLDRFILGIARTFPLELGLPPDVQPMDNAGAEARELRQALLLRLYDPTRREREGEGGQAAAKNLLRAFRLATLGRERKSLSQLLDKTIEDLHDFHREHGQKAWGEVARIWPGVRWWETPLPEAAEQARDPAYQDALRQAFGDTRRAMQLGETCATLIAAAAAHAIDRLWSIQGGDSVLRQLLAHVSTHSDPPTAVDYYRKPYDLPPSLWPPMRAALANLVAVEIERSIRGTRGTHALLTQYERLYAESQGREGRLSFDDLARALSHPAPAPSLTPGAVDRLYIDYRMDGQLDHWLLDEFQDTSDSQWRAIANLIDEVVQDPELHRSFCYVGDIKQSIYGWRGGNYRLFNRIRQRYGLDPNDTLHVCHRSLPAIVHTVNAVFAGLAEDAGLAANPAAPHPDALAAFGEAWHIHESAHAAHPEGFAGLVEYARSNGRRATPDAEREDEESGDPAQYDAVARILAELRPTLTSRTAAVLVRSNDQGRACADVLRRRLPGMAVVHEGTGGIVDNPLVTLLLAGVRYAAHPGDTLARRHWQMRPGADAASADKMTELPARLPALTHAAGFAGALRPWGEQLLLAADGDAAFSRQRLREFLTAAEAFDATGTRDPDAFIDAIHAYRVKAEAAAGAIRVMTIHQSKGLGFDIVLVPFDANAKSFASPETVRMLRSDCGKDETDPDGWVLQTPSPIALQGAGGAAREALEAARAEANFAQLCVLYVALTRAKRALYLLIPEPPKSATATLREADLLRARLCDATPGDPTLAGLPMPYALGDPNWHLQRESQTEAGGGDEPSPAIAPAPIRIRFRDDVARREPSKEMTENEMFPVRYLLDPEAGNVRHFGSAIHRLFERIDWLEETDLDALIRDWRACSPEPEALLTDVETQFRHCLSAPEVRALLARPGSAPTAEVWVEAPFDYVTHHQGKPEIVTGRFDRLVIERDAAHHPIRATVVDFKSNRVDNDAAMNAKAMGYRPQMRVYTEAAARLLDLPLSAVQAVLLFTRRARCVTLPPVERV